MSRNKHPELLSEHPLFRALVLMGGGLSLSCGGISQGDSAALPGGAAGQVGTAGAPSAGAGGAITVAGGSLNVPATAGAAGSFAVAGAGDSDGGAPLVLKCPYAQWNCTPSCNQYLANTGDPSDSRCVCDTSRPTSAASCAADQTLVCLQAYLQDGTYPASSWDGYIHVNCACVSAQAASASACPSACTTTFPTLLSQPPFQPSCRQPTSSSCDSSGVCTATSADVLRQDGITCGCYDITLR